MKRISTLCLLLVVFFAIPICGPNSLAGNSAPPVLSADGPMPFPPIPPLASSLEPVLQADGPMPFPPIPPLASSLA